MKIYDHDPRNLPDDLLSAIGLAIACAAQTEAIIEEALAGVAGMDYVPGLAMTAHMSMGQRFDALMSIARLRLSEAAVAGLAAIIVDAKKAFELRNTLAHQVWFRDPDTTDIFLKKRTARGHLKVTSVPKRVEEIRRDAIFIYQVGMCLYTFLQVNGLHPPLR